jgi:hypothetical protein
MEKVAYLQAFCRQGRIIIANCTELNELLGDKKDTFMIVPILFDTNHVQLREIDAPEMKDLLPNTIITSPFKPYLDNEKKSSLSLNSIAFASKKLVADAMKLAKKIQMIDLFNMF